MLAAWRRRIARRVLANLVDEYDFTGRCAVCTDPRFLAPPPCLHVAPEKCGRLSFDRLSMCTRKPNHTGMCSWLLCLKPIGGIGLNGFCARAIGHDGRCRP